MKCRRGIVRKRGVKLDNKNEKLNTEKSAKKELSIEELFEGFDGEYVKEEVDWGERVGKEM